MPSLTAAAVAARARCRSWLLSKSHESAESGLGQVDLVVLAIQREMNGLCRLTTVAAVLQNDLHLAHGHRVRGSRNAFHFDRMWPMRSRVYWSTQVAGSPCALPAIRSPPRELDYRLCCGSRTMRISGTPPSTWAAPSATKPCFR